MSAIASLLPSRYPEGSEEANGREDRGRRADRNVDRTVEKGSEEVSARSCKQNEGASES